MAPATPLGTREYHKKKERRRKKRKEKKKNLFFSSLSIRPNVQRKRSPSSCCSCCSLLLLLFLLLLLLVSNLFISSGDKHLLKACKSGTVNDVSQYLAANPSVDINGADAFGHTALNLGCSRGDPALVAFLLSRPDIDVNLEGKMGKTPLSISCTEGHLEVIKLLLAAPGINVNTAESNGSTPLHLAAGTGRVDVVELLMAQPGLDPNKKDRMMRLPVDVARAKKLENIVVMLLASDKVRDKTGKTSFHRAVADRDLQAVVALAADDLVDPNEGDLIGQTPFFLACKTGFVEAVAHLVIASAVDVNKPNNGKVTPIEAAAQAGQLEVVRLLRDSVRVEFPGNLLEVACKGRQLAIVRELIGEPRINQDLHKALEASCWEGDLETVNFLLTQEIRPLTDLDYLPFAGGQRRPEIDAALHEKVLAILNAKDADSWSTVEVANWVMVRLGLSPKLAALFRTSNVTGELLLKTFKNEDDLDTITFQAQERVLVFREKEKLRLQLEVKRGETEEIKFNDSDVFISYCWANAALVRDTATRLGSPQHGGYEVWLDIKKMRGNIYDAMENGVRNSRVFVAFISPQYAASANCQRELKLGNDLKKKIICCLVDPACRFENGGWPPPGIGTLVAGNLYIDLTKNYDDSYAQLLSGIQTILSPPPPVTAPTPSPAPAPAPATASTPPTPAATKSSAPAPTQAKEVAAVPAPTPQDVAGFMTKMLERMEQLTTQVSNLDQRLQTVERRLDSIAEQ